MSRVYDKDGNEVDIQDWRGASLRDQIQRTTIITQRHGQFRLSATLFWAAWGGVIAGYVLSLVLIGLSMTLWAIGSGEQNPAWATGFGSLVPLTVAVVATLVLVDYYKHHGMPRRVKEEPQELYCKKCQSKLEEELEIGKEQRATELLTELESLGIDVRTRELPTRVHDEVWRPPTD